jgi:Holliday junction resolvase RusA-like endonuclease
LLTLVYQTNYSGQKNTFYQYDLDSQIAELHLKRAYEKARPRIEVMIDPI